MAAPHPLSAVPDEGRRPSAVPGDQPAGQAAHGHAHDGHGHHHHHHAHDHHHHGAGSASVHEPRRVGASPATAAPPVVSALTMSAGARLAVAAGLAALLWALMAWAMV